jgi:hypothetical protein
MGLPIGIRNRLIHIIQSHRQVAKRDNQREARRAEQGLKVMELMMNSIV